MKRIVSILIVFCGIIFFSSCEKDDICVDGDTPLLVIRFYDQADTTIFKDVLTLRVQGFMGDSVYPVIPNAALDSIALPLRTDATTTSFIISRNNSPEDTTAVDVDTLIFSYETREEFVSRACGYVINYENLTGTTSSGDMDTWIEEIEILKPNILYDDLVEAQIKILH